MRKLILLQLVIFVSMFLSACGLVEGVFKSGFWTGAIVVIIIAIIIFFIVRASKNK